jgi:hypothetical protein
VGCEARGEHGLLQGLGQAQGEDDVGLREHALATQQAEQAGEQANDAARVWCDS